MAEPEVVWQGNEALRQFLVPIDAIEPFPDNPRKGDVEMLRASLQRWGQVLPGLVDPTLAADGRYRMVARHHLTKAAAAEGWTHIAVVANDFGSEDEARGYMVADNRASDLGGVDRALLAAQLGRLKSLRGTGYSDADRDELRERLAKLRDRPIVPPTTDVEVRFTLSREAHRDFSTYIEILMREWSVERADAILRAVREAAQRT